MLNLLHDIPHPCNAQPSIYLAYSVLILLVTSCLLLLFYFRCFTTTVTIAAITSISPLLLIFFASKYILGVVELTTQLLKLINILWLPFCRINKLGYLAREDYLDPLQLRIIKYCFLGRTVNDVKCLVKHFHMVQTQLEQISNVRKYLLANNAKQDDIHVYGIQTRGGTHT